MHGTGVFGVPVWHSRVYFSGRRGVGMDGWTLYHYITGEGYRVAEIAVAEEIGIEVAELTM